MPDTPTVPPPCTDELANFVATELSVTPEAVKLALELAASRLPRHIKLTDPTA